MADITKPDYAYIWADTGSRDKPTDLKILQGWTAEIPPYQQGNWVEYRQDTAIRYILQKGIAEWQDDMDYYAAKSVVNHLGKIYIARANSMGSAPSSTNADWEDLTPNASTTVRGKIAIATQQEVDAGTVKDKAVAPDTLKKKVDSLDTRFLQTSKNLTDLTNVNVARSALSISNLTNHKQAKASTTITVDGVYLSGGGNLDANRKIDMTAKSKAAITKIENLTFATLEGKPATYPPNTHTQPWSTITNRPADGNSGDLKHSHPVSDLIGDIPWIKVSGKPSTFPPSEHTQPWASITNRPANGNSGDLKHKHVVDDVTGSWPWNRITGIPSTFPPSSHSHNWNSITGKPATFPPSGHNQPWSTITGRPATADRWPSWNETTNKPFNDILITTGTLRGGETIPVPSGYSRENGKYLVSMNDFNPTRWAYDLQEDGNDVHYTSTISVNQSTGLITAVMTYNYRGSSTGSTSFPVSVDYLAIWVK